MSLLPSISCKCITYGRVDFLEESIYSFLQQDYQGERELVIVNDYPLQKLVFDHPDVRIYNLDTTFSTIGEKENFILEKCRFDVIAVWDDDDVAMPNHLNNIAKHFVPGSNLLHWQKGVLFNGDNIEAITSLGNSGIVYSRDAWEAVGRHPLENAGYDMTLVVRIHELGRDKVVLASPADEEVSWFYMWGGRGYHMSGLGTDDDTRPNAIQRHSAHVERLRQMGQIPTGEVKLIPNWTRNYKQILKDFNDKARGDIQSKG